MLIYYILYIIIAYRVILHKAHPLGVGGDQALGYPGARVVLHKAHPGGGYGRGPGTQGGCKGL